MKRPARDLPTLIEIAKQRLSVRQLAGARSVLAKALGMDNRSPTALQLMGIVSCELGNYPEAIRYLQRAAALAPLTLGAHLNLGKTLHLAGRIDDALAAFGTAARLGPAVPEVHLGYGSALVAAGNLQEAASRFREAIRLQPDARDAYYNLAKVLYELRDYETALGVWSRVLRQEPDSAEALLKIMVCKHVLCDWGDYTPHLSALRALIDTGRVGIGAAFASLWLWDESGVHRRCADLEAEQTDGQTRHFRSGALKRRQVIRLAYVSADFRSHAVPLLMTGLLEGHDRQRFETIAVALNKDDGSVERKRLEKAADAFIDVHRVSENEAIARRLREHEVDIAIDLMGHTEKARPGIFGHRAAPIQVNFLGFPSTSGIPAVDYLVSDPFIATAQVKHSASEKLVILPDCYQCNDRSRPVGIIPPARSSCALPENAFVFGSFNQQAKITPQVFDVWMRILLRVGNSVLWLLVDAEPPRANLRAEAEKRGVSSSRLIFATRTSLANHIVRLRLVDLLLDTFPYTAHTTGSDALWAGCPIVTLAGQSFPSRVCGSLLTTIGVPELITTNLDDYEQLAVNLAQDRTTLDKHKARIAQGRETSPLFDMSRFCRNLERAYEQMVAIAASGGQPVEIDVRTLS